MQSRACIWAAGLRVIVNKGTANTEQFLHLLGLQWQVREAQSVPGSAPPAWVGGLCTLFLPWHHSPLSGQPKHGKILIGHSFLSLLNISLHNEHNPFPLLITTTAC